MLRGALLASLAGAAALSVQTVDAQVVDRTACPYYAVDIADFYTCEPVAPADGAASGEAASESEVARSSDVRAVESARPNELAAVSAGWSNAGAGDEPVLSQVADPSRP